VMRLQGKQTSMELLFSSIESTERRMEYL